MTFLSWERPDLDLRIAARDRHEYVIVGGEGDVTVLQEAAGRVMQRANCRSIAEAELTADRWARDAAIAGGPW